jgi:cytochrome c biogenesis protein
MLKPPRFLTSRSTVIGLSLAVTLSLLAANLLPQRGESGKPPAWVEALPEGLRFVRYLGLDDIVGSGWFAALILLFCLSLILSTVSQYGAAKGLVNRIPQPQGEWIRVEGNPHDFAARLEAAGFRAAGSAGGVHRYVRHRSGYWGSFLLHLGLVTAVLFSFVYVVTQHKVGLRLVNDEVTALTPENIAVKRGILPLQGRIPATITLGRLDPRFYPNDRLQSLSSELYVTDLPGELPLKVDVALSDKGRFGSFRVYQRNPFGLAFDLEMVAPDGRSRTERLELPYPENRHLWGYGETSLGTDLKLKAKFVPDADGKTMEARNPLLTVRLLQGKTLLGETSLRPGERGRLGIWSVRLSRVRWWTEFLLDGSSGMAGIFAGFAIILAGVLSSYCLVPREIIVREEGGELVVRHYVRRFAQLYRDEFEALVAAQHREGGS